MILKKKLSLGLGFLFIIIFSLVMFSSYYIQKLSKESEDILRNNYDSIVYSKKMILALDDMKMSFSERVLNRETSREATREYAKLFESGKAVFEENLKAENNNITEVHEKEYVEILNRNYPAFIKLCGKNGKGPEGGAIFFRDFIPVYNRLRQTVSRINDINMQAVVRKNQLTKHDSVSIIIYITVIGTLCVIVAFGYIWYFPFYVSNSLSYLSTRMKELLKSNGINYEIKTDDEQHIILESINLLENDYSIMKKKKKKKNV
jgi:hypothetical protein